MGAESTLGVQEISGISTGGSAVTKPTIIVSGPGTYQPGVIDRSDITTYTVQPGDVIGAIASRFGISVNTILWANDLTARSYIRPGDVLKILPHTGLTHVVKRGDTVKNIANKYQVSTETLIAANHLEADGRDIVVGEELFVPDGIKPVPAYVAPVVVRNTTFRDIAAPVPSVTAPAGSNYVWPSEVRYISQYFGLHHTGIDIAGPIGKQIYAAAVGTVIKSQCGYNGGYGCHVIIDHGNGIHTLYAHAAQLLVSVGEEVTQGQVIALMGSTGHSTGPHVHFEVRVNGKFQNPLRYVR
jgi:murein DD-endopeptidase MepM/ murein hydrolase activator NlpD